MIHVTPSVAYSSGDSLGFIGVTVALSSEISSNMTTSTAIDDMTDSQNLKAYIQANYFNVAKNAAAGEGEYIDALYSIGKYNESISQEKFRKILHDDYKLLFSEYKYTDNFLPTLNTRIKVANGDL